MSIIYTYYRKNYFNEIEWTQDQAELTTNNLKKAFSGMKKDRNASIQVLPIAGAITIIWDTYTEFENDIVTLREYDNNHNYSEWKMSFNKAKKFTYDYLKSISRAA